ncbi:Bax inhibitor-1/YccA family protein [Microbacterium sp. Marseille-Q6965]|uniref:Bax inhibitor-1/YccA family protein n=1 Tax=Microbacterium sp. Marseille-Q6965 TaxID=2965072 RepID=UPI0021B8167B|nr:Bax inhibitor-1/YccA family protein [Microbacterium sp. Marseille-Q6965]
MASPGFNNPVFQAPQQGAYGTPLQPPAAQQPNVGYAQAGQYSQMGVDAAAQSRIEGAYTAPAAGAIETGRMTVEDTVLKTLMLFGALIVFAAVGWVWTLGGALGPQSATSINMLPWIIGALGGFVLGLVNSFKRQPSPALIFAYAAFEGLFVGGISAYFEFIWPGIVIQATLATVAVVGVTLALFANGKVRASAKATKIFMIAMIGYLVFSLLNVILMWTGVTDNAFGLRSVEFMGIPLGLIIGVLVVFMAAYSLVLDFDMIQQGVRNGAPRKFGWMGAFGIMVTVVWLYIEILRIIAILRGND